MQEKKKIIQTQVAGEEQKSWHKYRRDARQGEPGRLEDAAKFLSGMISISLTIFLSADKAVFQGQSKGLLGIVALLWLCSLLLAFMVLFPRPYRTNKNSAEAIEKAHNQVVRWKTAFLAGAVGSFLIALVMLTGVYVLAVG